MTKIGETFNASGYDWRVLAKDEDGNLLIVTDKIVGFSQASNTCDYAKYEGSTLDKSMIAFYEELDSDFKRLVQPVEFDEEQLTYDCWWIDEGQGGLSSVGGTTKKAFALSAMELHEYTDFKFGNAKYEGLIAKVASNCGNVPNWANVGDARHWWLRSGGRTASHGCNVNSTGQVGNGGSAASVLGLRPALWVKST